MQHAFGRRAFLGAAGVSALGAAPRTEPAAALPTIALGGKRVTRLIAGANPVNGYAHSTQRMSDLMVRYFTLDRTIEFLLACERQGIDTWQSSYAPKVRDALRAVWERGSRLQFICLASDRQKDDWKEILALKPIAIVHHGGVTDTAFHGGKPEIVHDYVKRVHDKGIMAGISTHNPDHLARIEDSGWEHQLYMTCLYNLTRTKEELRRFDGDQPVDELFLSADPKKMTERVRQVKKPCLAFKLLAAGRLSGTAAAVERCFEFAYKNIKPIDGAIVGMFPIINDEVAEDAALARRYATLS